MKYHKMIKSEVSITHVEGKFHSTKYSNETMPSYCSSEYTPDEFIERHYSDHVILFHEKNSPCALYQLYEATTMEIYKFETYTTLIFIEQL